MRRIFLTLIFLIGLSSISNSQVDTEFWFVVPELSHRGNTGGTPGTLRIATLELPATVTISMPANTYNPISNPNGFQDIVVNIAANSTAAVDLSHLIDVAAFPTRNFLENKPLTPSGINNFGLHITATNMITVYWEVHYSYGSDLWTLKGRNALGNLFYTPFQTFYNNRNLTPRIYSAIDIVATSDNTQITITLPPGKAASYGSFITGIPAGGTFTLTLNRGQTFSLFPFNYSILAVDRLAGTRIESSFPVSVSIKDDAMAVGSQGQDVIGDQIVPVNIVGNNYIVPDMGNPNHVYVLATQDNTNIYVYDASGLPIGATPYTTLRRGEQALLVVPGGSKFAHITSSLNATDPFKPFYTFQLGVENQARAGAIVPGIGCAGNTQLAFTRARDENKFQFFIVVRRGNEDKFLVDGIRQDGIIDPGAFTEIPGSGGYMALYSNSINTNVLTVGQHLVENTGDIFQLGIFNGFPGAGQGGLYYGYYSDFGGLNIGASVAGTNSITVRACYGDPVQLYAYGGTNYRWTPDTYLDDSTSNLPTAIGMPPGPHRYTVEISGACATGTTDLTVVVSDSVRAFFETNVSSGCSPLEIQFEDQSTGATSWQYNLGDGTPFIRYDYDDLTPFPEPPQPFSFTHTYINTTSLAIPVTVTLLARNQTGCRDTVTRTIMVYPEIQASFTSSRNEGCSPFTVEFLNNSSGAESYHWDFGDGTTSTASGPQITKTYINNSPAPVTYTIRLRAENEYGCFATHEEVVTVYSDPVPTISGPRSACLNSAGNIYSTEPGMSDYEWTVTGGLITSGDSTGSITVIWNSPGFQTVSVNYSDLSGCKADSPANYYVSVSPALTGSITSQTNVLSFGGSSGSVTVSGYGGIPPYEYSIDSGPYQSSGTFLSLIARNYIVTIRDSILCTFQVPVAITQPVQPLATLTTLPASSVTSTTAISGGNIISAGEGTIFASGVCWSTSSLPTITDSYTTDGTGSGAFTSLVTGLMPGTIYYLRAYATNGSGTSYGEELSFHTLDRTEPDDCLTLWYPFNGNANEETGFGTDGTVNGAILTDDRFGNTNSAYYFNGTNNSITIPGNLPVTNSFTISFWAYLEKESGYSNILSDGNINYGGNDFLINFRNNDIGIRADKGGTPLNYEYSSPEEMTNLNLLNRWVHVAWVMNPAGSVIYLDGSRIAEVSVPGTNEGFHDDHVTIGARHVWTDMDNYFQGKLDELRIYNCVLNDQEISDLYSSEGATRPLVVTNSLTEITGTSAMSGGNIITDGGSPVIARGVCWSTSSNPTIADNITTDGSGTGTFTSSITDLLPGTRYFLRSYATNNEGTIYGNEFNFVAVTNPFANCGTVTDADGNVYNTVTIGSQCWMQENLKTTRYNDGTYIPLVTDGTQWGSLSTPAFCWNNNDASSYKNSYGAIYNWYAVNTNKLCPTGWHVPTINEWTELINHLGGWSEATDKLREIGTIHWNEPNTGATNETGFTALPGGGRNYDGPFLSVGEYGHWWSATESHLSYAWDLSIYPGGASQSTYDKQTGTTIRCLQGEAVVLPSIATADISSITSTSAISGGNITSDGGSPVIARGVCWGTTPNPILENSSTSDGTGIGVFIGSITGLTSGTIYYVRAYATNSAGTTYGNEISFTTALPVLTLTGSGDACIGSPASLRLGITGGMQPFTVNYTMNGIDQPLLTGYTSDTDINPGILPAGTYTFMITSVLDADSNPIPAAALPPSYSFEIYDIPNAWATINNSPGICNDGITDIILHSSVPNSDFIYTVTYSPSVEWQSGKSPESGILINGEGLRLAQNLAHYSAEPVIVTYTIMPLISGAVYCPGSPVIVNIIVTPEGQVNRVSDILMCNGAISPPVLFTTVNTGGTTDYVWTNSNPAIGLPASGTGGLPSFTTINSGDSPLMAVITVMPFNNSGPANCAGPAQSFTITVNPAPRVVPINVESELCYGDYTQIVLTSPTFMTSGEIVFDYSVAVPAGVTGNASPGTDIMQGDDLSFQYRNYSDTVQSVYFSITPKVAGMSCPAGRTVIQQVRVHPKPIRSITITKPFTCNATEGLASLRAEVSEGAGPYHIAWTGPAGYHMEDAAEITNLYAGYYNLNVIDNIGCSGDTAIAVANLSSSPRIVPIPVLPDIHVSCPEGNNGTARIYVRDGITNPYSYRLVRNDTEILFSGVFAGNYNPSDPNTFRVCTGLMAGQYQLIIRDINGCENIRTAELKEPLPITVSFNVSSYNGSGISCFGQSDGSITATVTGGNGNYSFAWTGPDGFTSNEKDISGLRAGNYTIRVTDFGGCVSTENVTLTEPGLLRALLEFSDISCNGTVDGTISISTPAGGSGTYGYTIDGGTTWQGTGSYTSLYPGIYDVRIRDAVNIGCSVIINPVLVISDADSARLSSTLTPQPICSGTRFIYEAAATNPDAILSWTRSPVSGIAGPATSGTGGINEVLINTTDSPVNVIYTYSVILRGCNINQDVLVTVYPLPVATAGGTQTICQGDSATVSGATYSNGVILWTTNGEGGLSGSHTLAPTYAPAPGEAGKTITLTMTVTGTGNCGMLSDTATYRVIVKESQTISFNPLEDKVYGDPSFILTASSGSSLAVNYTCSDDSVITISGNRVTIRGAGTATIYASQPGDLNHCPAMTVFQTLKVAQIPIMVRADSLQSKVYGDADPVLTYSVYPELAADKFTGSLIRDEGENSGIVYAVNQGTLTAGPNYKMTFVPGSFTISTKPVTVTPEHGQNKTYGSDDPVLKFKINPGLVNGDKSAGALTRVPGENSGFYPILPGNLSLGNNYAVSFVPATFTIKKAPLIVTGDKKERRYLDSNPVFEIYYSGFVKGEDKSVLDFLPSLAALPDTLSDAGKYSVTIAGGSDDNYYYVYVHGILTILKKDQTITSFNTLPKFLRTTQRFPLEATASSGLEVRFVSSDEDKATISGNVMTIEKEGSVDIIAVQDGDKNWNPAPPVYQRVIGQPTFDNVTSLFTPNSDGMNDHWHIVDIEDFGQVEVKVYNRFGKLVYESSDYKNDWKGDFNGSPLPEASYYYIIKSAKRGVVKGVVNIVR